MVIQIEKTATGPKFTISGVSGLDRVIYYNVGKLEFTCDGEPPTQDELLALKQAIWDSSVMSAHQRALSLTQSPSKRGIE